MASFMQFVSDQWLLFSLLGMLVTGFFILESKKGGKTVSYHEATRMLNGDEAVLLDVRDAAEYRSGHIVDAINIPYADLAKKVDELEKYKSKTVIVADKMGQHAGASGKVLIDNGYTVVRLSGGVSEWAHQNLPLVKA